MIYFDNGATSYPKPKSVIDIMTEGLSKPVGNIGRTQSDETIKLMKSVITVRKELCEYIGGTDYKRVIFTKNSTEASNLVLNSVVLEGKRILSTTNEHNSVIRPLSILANDRNAEVIFAKPENLENLIPDYDVLVVNHVSNATGEIIDPAPLGKLCKKHGVTFILDISQSLGHLPIKLGYWHVNAAFAPGHKGLMGPVGTGFLYFDEGISVKPLIYGGTGTETRNPGMPKGYPESLEAGTGNHIGILGMGAALNHIIELGIDNIEKKEKELQQYLYNRLREIDISVVHKDGGLPIFSLHSEKMDSGEISMKLHDDFGIITRSGLLCAPLVLANLDSVVRVSLSYYITKDEVDIFIEALKNILGE